MAKGPDTLLSSAVLAEKLHLSPATVSKILKILAEGALVVSVRGAVGGYRLSRPADAITVVDVIEAMEGDLTMTECCDSLNLCSIGTACAMQENWVKINGLIKAVLSKISIVEMVGSLSLEGLLHGK